MRKRLATIPLYSSAFLRWTAIATLIGLLCGTIGGLFALAVDWATHTRESHGFLLYLLPVGGLVIVALYRLLKLPASMGTNEIITTVRTQSKVPLQLSPAIFFSTVITHLLGGSSGREGAALQLGGSLGAAVGRLTGTRYDRRRICQLCGMAALFSALFGTPLTATIFVLEMVEVGRVYSRAMFPCCVAAIVAKLTAAFIGVHEEPFFLASSLIGITPLSLVQSCGMAVLCSLTAVMFCVVMHASGKAMRRWIPNDYLRIAVGGCAVILLTLVLNTRDYLGGGMHIIFSALDGNARPEAFLLKLLFTAVTLSAGFKGGEIVPSVFVGATMGCTGAALLGLPPQLGAALGMIGVFCGVTNAPLASLMLSIELFGSEYLPLFGLVTLTSFMLSGHHSLYHAQTFAELKLGREE